MSRCRRGPRSHICVTNTKRYGVWHITIRSLSRYGRQRNYASVAEKTRGRHLSSQCCNHHSVTKYVTHTKIKALENEFCDTRDYPSIFKRNVLRVLCLRPRTKIEGREVIKIFPCFVKCLPTSEPQWHWHLWEKEPVGRYEFWEWKINFKSNHLNSTDFYGIEIILFYVHDDIKRLISIHSKAVLLLFSSTPC